MTEWEIIIAFLLSRPCGILLFLMADQWSSWKLKNHRGWKHCCAFNATQCRVQRFLDKWMEPVHSGKDRKCGMNDSSQQFPSIIDWGDKNALLKIQTCRTFQGRASILKKHKTGLVPAERLFEKIKAKTWNRRWSLFHGNASAFQGRELPYWQQPLANWSSSNPSVFNIFDWMQVI